MSIEASFLEAAAGRLRLDRANLKYNADGKAILSFSGWHQDGMPFAFASAPFDGDLDNRSTEIALDIIRAHHGKHMPAPAQIKSLASTLRDALTRATQDAALLSEQAKSAVGELNDAISQGNEIVSDVRAATAEVRAALGLNSNGGPSGPLPGAEQSSSG